MEPLTTFGIVVIAFILGIYIGKDKTDYTEMFQLPEENDA